ncbi:uncharacterized protein LOC133378846 [Rhineura floridana]|uniref:uncharacterized protein LOC133378846 n=1 Tax=Rhineura floridana TaxID=261503 RepID=UPI002AC8869C|nr:uncharacterized protein LOC133378846 [Rhineura floridana]
MWAYSSPIQEGKRLWVCTSALILILGGLLGRWITEVRAAPISREAAAPGLCPTIHRFIPRDSKAFIPIPRTKGFSILCKVNTSSSRCEWVLLASRGRSYYFNMDLKEHLILYNMGLIITRMSKELEGEYHVLSGINKTCEGRVFMTAVGPLFLYRIFLLIPGIVFLCGLGLLWDWLIKARNRLATSEEGQGANARIQHVIPPLDLSRNP